MSAVNNPPLVVLGVSGSIAAYKSCDLVRRLQDAGFAVTVIMTENATKFITPLTLQTLTGRAVVGEMFSSPTNNWQIDHVDLAQKANLLLIAPASANIIAKLAAGMADDMLTATALASRAVKVVAPAMNTNMYESPITRENCRKLKEYGYHFVEPIEGKLACGVTGPGHLAEVSDIVAAVKALLQCRKI
jgi:phosphopantothenoylcysteine decarboxylase / phosphopantothenate---cysteine ligase